MVPLTNREAVPDVDDRIDLIRGDPQPLLFAIARDTQTIFATWNINWRTIFAHSPPSDRQVHLRVVDRNGLIETKVAVEAMSAMHYVTITGLCQPYHVEIGYFQPLQSWHLVTRSKTVEMPPQGKSALTDVELATIPFHVNFQRLSSLFGATNGAPVARIVAEFQRRVLHNSKPNEVTRFDSQTLRDLKLSVSRMATAERDFKSIDTGKLALHGPVACKVAATSPLHAFQSKTGS